MCIPTQADLPLNCKHSVSKHSISRHSYFGTRCTSPLSPLPGRAALINRIDFCTAGINIHIPPLSQVYSFYLIAISGVLQSYYTGFTVIRWYFMHKPWTTWQAVSLLFTYKGGEQIINNLHHLFKWGSRPRIVYYQPQYSGTPPVEVNRWMCPPPHSGHLISFSCEGLLGTGSLKIFWHCWHSYSQTGGPSVKPIGAQEGNPSMWELPHSGHFTSFFSGVMLQVTGNVKTFLHWWHK